MIGTNFRVWLRETVLNHLDDDVYKAIHYVLMENTEEESQYRAQGYIPFVLKYPHRSGIPAGERVWYHPQSKDVKPMGTLPAAPAQPMPGKPQMPGRSPMPGKPQMPGRARPSSNVTSQRINLNVPFEQKDQAKVAGARWDNGTRTWYAPPGTPIEGIAQWMPSEQQSQTPQQLPQQPGGQLRPGESPGEQWVCGIPVEGNEFGIPAMVKGKDGQLVPYRIIARPDANGTWEVWDEHIRGREGVTTTEIKTIIQANRDEDGKPIKTSFPMKYLRESEYDPATKTFVPKKKEKKRSNTIDPSKISDEQKEIDEEFARMMASPEKNHMMTSANPGTGKTTILKHVAWKYGKPGQRWLYLVFNTKNKEEASQDFPDWVNVQTTNGFLGKMLGSPENMETFPQTDWIATLENGKSGGESGRKGKKIEKAKIIADTPEFAGIMNGLGIPDPDPQKMSTATSSNSTLYILRELRKHFQRQVLKLLGLAKSYALDPRSEQDAAAGLELLIEDYESQVDVRMTNVKDKLRRMAKSNPYDYSNVIADLTKIFQTDFYSKNFGNEVMQATYWMMQQMMPHASQHKYQHDDGNEYNLANYRDFDDDFWYSAIHSKTNEIKWPHYDVVLADEVQDFNEDQSIMLDKLEKASAKVVAVGDENQALYRFRGADSEAFRSIGTMLAAASANKNIHKRLTKNFRSRPAIINNSNENTHVKDLKAGREFDDRYEGSARNDEDEYDDAFDKLKWEQNKFGFRKETAFIARTNEPLVHAALKLMTDGIPFVVLGKDISKSLREHINLIKKESKLRDYSSVSELMDSLDSYYNSEEDVFRGERTKDDYLKELKETTEALMSAINQFKSEQASTQGSSRPGGFDPYANQGENDPSIKEFETWIYQRLGGLDAVDNAKDAAVYRKKMEEQNPVVLTTAHKSKGLEFERVYILRADQFPHPKNRNSPKDMVQEANAKLVSLTRAKNDISTLKLDNQPGYEGPKVGREEH